MKIITVQSRNPLAGMAAKSAAFAALLFASAGLIWADVPAPVIREFQPPDTNGAVRLRWDAVPGSAYVVQTTTDLVAGAWTPVDFLTANTNTVTWQANGQGAASGFYRLTTAAVGITSVEPGYIPTNTPTTIYITGQGFDASDVVTAIGPGGTLALTNRVVISPTLIAVSLPAFTPDLAGTYQLLVTSGSGRSAGFSYAWTLVSQPSGSAYLLEPPRPPPAAPSATLLMPALMKAKEKSNQARFGSGHGVFEVQDYSFDIEQTSLIGSQSSSAGAGRRRLDPYKSFKTGDAEMESTTRHLRDKVEAVLFSGEVQVRQDDLVIPGRGLAFVWARTYRSRTAFRAGMSYRWTYSYDVSVAQTPEGIAVADGTGRSDVYYPGTNGVYSRPEFFNEGTLSNGVFTLTFPDTGKWIFNAFNGTSTAGKLAQIVDRNGNAITLGYDSAGRLTQIVDDLGRTNVVAYNSSGQLMSVTDFSGRAVTYAYYTGEPGGSVGDLKSVTSPPVTGTPNGNDFPSGKTTTYTYSTGFSNEAENHLLLSITDPSGQTPRAFTYDHNASDFSYLRCTTVQCGDPTNLTYYTYEPVTPSARDIANKVKSIIVDKLGYVIEASYDSRNRLLDLKQYTGRAPVAGPATDNSNRPVNPMRATDPAYFETQWTWNRNSLCVQEVEPRGNSVRYVYESDYNPGATPRKQGDLRAVHVADIDGDGLPDLVTRYEYDPRFGSAGVASQQDRYARESFLSNASVAAKQNSVELLAAWLSKKGYDYYQAQTARGWDGTIKGSAVTDEAMSAKGWDGTIKGNGVTDPAISAKGWDGTIKGNGVAINTKGTGADKGRTVGLKLGTANGGVEQSGFGNARGILWRMRKRPELLYQRAIGDLDQDGRNDFAISMTDPNGNLTTASYDPNGNLLEARAISVSACGANKPTINAAYDAHGQVVAITNIADGNCIRAVDTFSYYASGPQAGCVQSATRDAGGLSLTWSFEYDARGNVSRCIDPRSNDWLFTYNALDQLMQVSSAALGGGGGGGGFRIASRYSYDANDNLVRVDQENRDYTGTLDSKNPQWSTLYQYDALNRCVQVQQNRDASYFITTQLQYDPNGNVTLVRSPEAVNSHNPDRVVQYVYDERNLPFQSVCAPGTTLSATRQRDYDLNGNLSRVLDEALAPTLYSYDGFDRCISVRDAMGNVASYVYDANGNLLQAQLDGEITDAPGSAGNQLLARTTYHYDALDRCVQASDLRAALPSLVPIGSGVANVRYAYAANGEWLSATDDNGHATRYAYDSAGRLVSTTDPKTNTVAYAYDGCGNLVSVTETDQSDLGGKPQVFVCTAQYDALNRCTSSSDNIGNTETFAYDSRDNPVRQTDAKAQITGRTYDGLGRCTIVIADLNGDGALDFSVDAGLRTAYDDNGCVISRTDANTNTTTYAYDALDRCYLATAPNGTHHTFVWDSRSELVSRTDPNGTMITNSYDAVGRLIHRDIAARGAAAASTTFETFAYDGCSRLVLASNDVSRLVYAYDSLGNCASSSQDGLTTSYTYDGVGNCLSMTYPSGRIATYSYDAGDQVTAAGTSQGGLPPATLAGYAYDGPGRVSRITRNNGVNTRVNWDGQAGVPNSSDDFGFQQVSRINHAVAGGAAIIDQRRLAYDGNQNETVRAQLAEFVVGQGMLTNQWIYNPLNMLAHAIKTKGTGTTGITEDYSLDAVGNRFSVASNGTVQIYSRSSANPPGDFQMDRYTVTPFGSNQYDANGNLVQVGTAAGLALYTYDYADRLVLAQVIDSGTGILTTNSVGFAYDALGNRLSKTVYSAGPSAPVTTYYLKRYRRVLLQQGRLLAGSDDVLEQYSGGPSGSIMHVFCWGSNCRPIGDLDGDGFPDVVACFSAAGALEYYPLSDNLGNVLALTDAGGNVLERYEYDDFGAPQFLTSDGTPRRVTSSAYGNSYLFHGMEWDAETGLYHGGGEELPQESYYDAQTGRYLLKAGVPLGIGQNGYCFGHNNPWSPAAYSRDKLKGTTKTQGDFNLANRAAAAESETVVFRPSRGEIR